MILKTKKAIAMVTAIMSVMSTMVINASALSESSILEQDLLSDSATAEENFVASFDTVDEMNAAELYVDNTSTLAQASKLMDTYIDGESIISATSTSSNSSKKINADYYPNITAPTGHRICFIETYVSMEYANEDYPNGQIEPLQDCQFKVTSKNGVSIYSKYSTVSTNVATSPYYEFNQSLIFNDNSASNSIYNTSVFSDGRATTDPTPLFSLRLKTGNLTEKEIINNVSAYVGGNPLKEAWATWETFAVGDIYRDGKVDQADLTALTNYVNYGDINEFNYTFNSDGEVHYPKATCLMAADINLDGDVNLQDMVLLNQYLKGKVKNLYVG